jgi:hypothetical protein
MRHGPAATVALFIDGSYCGTIKVAFDTSSGRAVVPFFAFPADIRNVIYTTNAVDAIHDRNALLGSGRKTDRRSSAVSFVSYEVLSM